MGYSVTTVPTTDDYLAMLLDHIHPGQRVHPRTLRHLAGRQRWDTGLSSVREILELLQDDEATFDRLRTAPRVAERIFVTTAGSVYRRRFTTDERHRAIIDVSNVAWTIDARKPRVRPVTGLVAELRARGVTDIVGVADANIRHVIHDAEHLAEVQAQFDRFLTAPAGTTADEMIIDCIAAASAIIISNDRFRDWKKRRGPAAKAVWRLLVPVGRRPDGTFDMGELGDEITAETEE
ncbi:MAG: hypothetical protein PF508_02775 [Spirochaeta sp.]|jgi:hypothetical protein|nr:hypothetical protein [Spirochaeta sp.]